MRYRIHVSNSFKNSIQLNFFKITTANTNNKNNAYYLQRLDCNCNDCGFLQRDFEAQNKAKETAKASELWLFEQRKKRLLENAEYWRGRGEQEKADRLIHQAKTLKFQFTSSNIQYGNCGKFHKAITFIANLCEPDNQKCFIHRKDYLNQ